MDWCRLWHDMPNDPKFRTIARLSQSRTSDVISVFIHLMVSASANAGERGRTQPNAEDLASALDLETERVESILSAMQGRVLDGESLSGWKKRQPKREDGSAERAKEWRDFNKLHDHSKSERNSERTRTHANARDHQTRRDETRRDSEVLDKTTSNLHIPSVSTASGDQNNHQNGRDGRNGSSDPTVLSNIFSRESQMRAALHGFMRMQGTSYERKFKVPDPAIIARCLDAVGPETEMHEVFDFLHDRYANHNQSPRHANGPKKYGWFVPVLEEQFGRRSR